MIVVDDASTDATADVLAQFSCCVEGGPPGGKFEWVFLWHDENRGKGSAVRTGLARADAELTVIHDADLEYHPRDLLRMLPLFINEDANAVFGSRFASAEFRRALFFRHEVGNKLLTFLCDLVCDLNISDMETCYKMARTRLLKSIPLESRDFRIEPELTIKLAKRGAHLYEVPISYSGRTYQEGKKINGETATVHSAPSSGTPSPTMSTPRMRHPEVRWPVSAGRHGSRHGSRTQLRPHIGERVLELGAGIGTLTVHLIPRERYWATDDNQLYVDELRHLRRTRPYLNVALVDPLDARTLPRRETFDTVLCGQRARIAGRRRGGPAERPTFADQWRSRARRCPVGPSLYGDLDATRGRRRRYTVDALTEVALKAGYHTRELHEIGRAGVPAWWLARRLRTQHLGLVPMKALNVLVPIMRTLDHWLPFPPLSLLAVLEKDD